MLGEPAPTSYDLNFAIFGFRVRISPWFWLTTLILGYSPRTANDPITLLTWVVAVLLSIMIHELGHAYAMRAYGFQPWIVLYGMGGLTCRDSGYGYYSKGNDTLGQILISAAGPAAGFLSAALILLGLYASGLRQSITYGGILELIPFVQIDNPHLSLLLFDFFFIAIAWGLVNLLPIYPLDGGHIARELLLKFNVQHGIRWSLFLSIATAGTMALVGLILWKDQFVAIFFALFAAWNYMTLKNFQGSDPW